ncbi:MAG: hypothetical protein K2Q23_18180 [Bryobacteraceae bacterium]|nr:hypothetical protein [Bryobacteraceae bacterium]
MAEKIVTIEIDESGNSSIDLEGFQGKGCADVTKTFQGGDKVVRSEKKREYHVEASHVTQRVNEGR